MADPIVPDAAAPVRARRWPGRLLRAVVMVALGLVLLWIFAPTITVCVLRHWLPLDFDGGQLGALATTPLNSPTPVACRLSPRDARRILSGASGYWLPPWYLRSGQSAAGMLQLDATDSRSQLPWQVQVTPSADIPQLDITLTSTQLEALTAPYHLLKLGPMSATWKVSAVSLVEVPGASGQAQSWSVLAAGAMHLSFNGWGSEVQIRHFQANLTLIEHPLATGWRPQLDVTISQIDVEGEQSGLLSSPQSRHQLEQVISARVNAALRNVIVPPWFPSRIRLLASVRPVADRVDREVTTQHAPP